MKPILTVLIALLLAPLTLPGAAKAQAKQPNVLWHSGLGFAEQ